ncbi:MAG: cell surface protein SprA [Fibrobacterota bacterium]|nr:cell surface protein SprA [Fibrobacterota bacterium]QQS07025.1 MAG: cell surface protein SprA [Fibrobacterota bacterium]
MNIRSTPVTTEYQIGFDTRAVDIRSFVRMDSTLGLDSIQLWQGYYGELSDYLTDVLAQEQRRLVRRELVGQSKFSDSGKVENRYELPVKIPEWAKRLGLTKPALTLAGSYTLQLKANSHWTNLEEQQGTANKVPDFSPEQIPNINLTGNIGKFVSISLTWNQEGFGATQNQALQIRYAGEKPEDTEDDILQEAEFGLIQLALPGSSLTGYSEAASGLLGIKTRMRFGDLDLTLVGGTQKGEQQKQHVGRTARDNTTLVRDRDLVLGSDFFLSYDHRKNWIAFNGDNRKLAKPVSLEVWQRILPQDLRAHPEWTSIVKRAKATSWDSLGRAGFSTLDSRWRKLNESTEWVYQGGVLRLLRSDLVGNGSALAAKWTGAAGAHTGSSEDMVLLFADDHEDAALRSLQLRNRYRLPSIGERDRRNLKVRILDLSGRKTGDNSVDSTGREWSKVFGITDESGNLLVDNTDIFDWGARTLNLPGLEPFRKYGMTGIYDSTRTALPGLSPHFGIEITSKSASDSIKIGSRDYASVSGSNCVDILPGSEVLTLNGSTRLEKGKDYDVQYQTGTITLLSDRARAASADIQVDFSCTPFFSLENRSVFGARLEYQLSQISKESVLGGTFLYRKESVTDLRPQLAREGNQAMLWGANLRLTGESESMTEIVNKVPLVKSTAESKWRLELEGAQSWTDPSLDGYALVEDFEGSQVTNELPISAYSWSQATPPGGVPLDADYEDTLDYRHQGEFTWSSNSRVLMRDVYPQHDDGSSSPARMSVLQLRLRPNDRSGRGMSWGGIMRAMPSSWRDNSNTRYLEVVAKPSGGGELYLDIGQISEDLSIGGEAPDGALQGEDLLNGQPTGVPQNDFGLDGRQDTTESRRGWECFGRNCQDTLIGRIGYVDPAGDNYHADRTSANPDHAVNGTENNNTDLGGGANTYFDSEDLDRDGSLATTNSFDRFRIILNGRNRTPFQSLGNAWRLYRIPLDGLFKKKGRGANWSEVRAVRVWYGALTPATGANQQEDKVQIARMAMVGNQWKGNERLSANDHIDTVDATYSANWTSLTKIVTPDSSRLNVSVIGNNTDQGRYKAWGVPEVKDPSSEAVQSEQSLRLTYANLHRGIGLGGIVADTGKALRYYESPRDFTLYKNLVMLVYHEVPSVLRAGEKPVRFGVQFGSGDPTNPASPYYEYSFNPVPLACGGTDCSAQQRADAIPSNWEQNQIRIPLASLTSLKTKRDAQGRGKDSLFKLEWGEGSHSGPSSRKDTISVYGDPSVSQVKWMRMWVRPNNTDAASQEEIASGELWVNDLRLEDPHQGIGTALRGSAQMNFADLMDVSASTEYRGGDFVPMGQKQPELSSQKSSARATATTSLYLQKFLPESWKAQLPVSFTITGLVDRPWARPGSDQELTRDGLSNITSDWWNSDMRRDSADIANRTSRAYQTLVVSRTLGSSWSRGRDEESGLKPILTNTFFARPKVNWTYTEQGTLGPDRRDSTWAHNLRLDYDFSPAPPPQYRPFSEAKGKWVPSLVENLTIQPWPATITSTLGDLDYLEGIHSILAPDKDSLPRNTSHDARASLSHGINGDWQLLDFLRLTMGERSSRLWDRREEAQRFDPSTGLVEAMPYILDWDTTRVRLEPVDGGETKRQTFGFLRNEGARSVQFGIELNPRILPWLSTTGSFQANASANRESPLQRVVGRDTVQFQFWRHDHTDNFRSNMRLDVPAILQSVRGVLPDDWGKSIDEVRQGLDRWRWTGFGVDYSVDDRISGVRQTLDYSSAMERLDAGSLLRWQMGLGDADNIRGPLDIITGSRSKSGLGQYRPSRLDNPADYPGVADLTDREAPADRTAMVNTRSYRVSGNSDFTVPGLLLSVHPSLAYQISWDERWSVPWNVDTTKTWPQITVSADLANFAGRVPFLVKWFESATANHSTTWELSQQIHPHLQSADVDNYTWRWQPLVGLQLKTKGNWSFEDRTNFSRTRSLNHLKRPLPSDGVRKEGACPESMGLPIFYSDPAINFARCFEIGGTSEDRSYEVGNEGTATYRIQTKRGIQIFKWFLKLDNDLVITFKAGWTKSWKEKEAVDLGTFEPVDAQTLDEVTTVYGGSNASYNFTSRLVANFDASYKRTERKAQEDNNGATVITNEIQGLASLQYKF